MISNKKRLWFIILLFTFIVSFILGNILVSRAIICKKNDVTSSFQEAKNIPDTSVVETTQTAYANNIDSQKIEVAGFSYDVEKFSTAAIPKINLQKLYFEESNKDCKLIREYEAKNNINHIEECTIATVRFDLNNDQNDEIIAFVRNSFFCGIHGNGAVLVYETNNEKIKNRIIIEPVISNLDTLNKIFSVALFNNQVCAFYIEGKIIFFSS